MTITSKQQIDSKGRTTQYMISYQERWIQNVQPSERGPSYFRITIRPSYQFFNIAWDSFFRHFHLYRWTVFSQSRMFNILSNWSNSMSSSNSSVPLFTPKILWNLHSEGNGGHSMLFKKNLPSNIKSNFFLSK